MSTVKWKLDPAHSELTFKVRHLMISTVTGHFRKIDLEVETVDDDFTRATNIRFTADVDSIDTNNEQRDTHLKSADFFHGEEHSQLVFVGDSFESDGDDAKLHGNLTVKGTTKPIVVNVEFGGITVDPYGQTKAGFTVTGKISRSAFGLTWSAVTEAGSVVVGDDVKFNAEIQLIKQA
ncbi:MAG TPA: YceI family protein [Mucilaginibacter sp.]